MPNGFWYAGGDTHTVESSIPSSAFSKGDILCYSSSSLSRLDTETMPADIAGVALADSIDSIDDQVSYIVPGPDTLFWASTQSVDTTALAPGAECDIKFAVAENRYYLDPSSTGTVAAVIVRGNTGYSAIDQSVQSKVLCKLIYHSGQLELS